MGAVATATAATAPVTATVAVAEPGEPEKRKPGRPKKDKGGARELVDTVLGADDPEAERIRTWESGADMPPFEQGKAMLDYALKRCPNATQISVDAVRGCISVTLAPESD